MLTLRVVALGLCAAALTAPHAAADEPFYKGKRLTLIINFAAGGPTDIEGRLLAKHLSKHIEGNPGIVVQNMDGAGGMVGAGYLGEVAPKDGTALGYFTGSAWRYANNPERFRVDFRSYEFVAYQPGTAVIYMRTDVAPGIRTATDIVKAKGVVAGGLGAENSKDLLIRLGLDMLGVPYKYVTAYRGSQAARLALQQNEINLYSESPPSYRAVVEPSLVRDGVVIPIWYEAIPDGEAFKPPKQVEGLPILPFHQLHTQVKGTMPAGQLWDTYRACTPSTDRCSARSCFRRACRRQRSRHCARPLDASTMTRNMPRRRSRPWDSCRNGRPGPTPIGGAPGDRDRARDTRLHRRLREKGGEVVPHIVSTILPKCLFARMCACASTA